MYYWTQLNPNRTIHPIVNFYDGMCLDVMMGYICYDTLNELRNTRDWDVLGHHVLGFISHILTRIAGSGIASHYSMMVFLCEASTPMLHFSWLLHGLKFTDTMVFKLTVVGLILAFFVFRVLLTPYMCWSMYDTFSQGLWDDSIFYLNIVVIGLFTLLNFFWFYKLLSVAMKVGTKKEKDI